MDNIHDAVMKYYSFSDYEMIEALIKVHGSDEDKTQLKEYIKKYSECVLLVHNNRVKCGSDIGPNKVTFKLEIFDDTVHGREMVATKRTISKFLSVRTSQLHLVEIRKGCLNFDFSVPECVVQRVFNLPEEDKKRMFKDSLVFIEAEV